MTDLHTHILPGIDDGAHSAEESLSLLRAERDSGVTAVMLTPHYFPEAETPDNFLRRRADAYETLQRKLDTLDMSERASLPTLHLSAEVAWGPNICVWPDLDRLCCPSGGQYLLLELPSMPWDSALIRKLYDLMSRTGLIPILAHIDRYLSTQPKEIINELLGMGLPAQISADTLLHAATRHSAMQLIRQNRVQFIVSDCHKIPERAPRIGDAAAVLRFRLGNQCAETFLKQSDEFLALLTDTRETGSPRSNMQ